MTTVAGVQNYSGMMTITAIERSLQLYASLEFPDNNIQKSIVTHADKVIDNGNIIIDNKQHTKWFDKSGLCYFGKGPVKPDIIYGQPNISTKHGISKDFKKIFEILNGYRPEYFLFIIPAKFKDKIIAYFKSSNGVPNYKWTVVRISALTLGIPVKASYFCIVGSKKKLSPVVKELTIENLPTINDRLISLYETNEYRLNIDRIKNHDLLPYDNCGIQMKLLWDSIPILEPGQALYDFPDEYPLCAKEYQGKLLKIQMPVRPHLNMPIGSISVTPKYIHPVLARPLTIRELARISMIPDSIDFGTNYLKGFRYLSNLIPQPVCEYAFSLVDSTHHGEKNNIIFIDASKQVDALYKDAKKINRDQKIVFNDGESNCIIEA